MIIIPNNKWEDMLENIDVSIPDIDDYKEYYEKYIQDVPFSGDFDRGDWIITRLKPFIHETLSSYRLFTQNILSEHGIEEQLWIDFEDQNQEVLFKLKYL